jgi:hypothetical protein
MQLKLTIRQSKAATDYLFKSASASVFSQDWPWDRDFVKVLAGDL